MYGGFFHRIQAQSCTYSALQQLDKTHGIRALEPHGYLSLLHWCGPVQSEVGVAMIVEEDLQYVQHTGHLCEDQSPGWEE